MNFTNREKQLLLGNAPVLSRITLYAEDGTALQVFNENDYLVDWDYEDFRYVPDQGFIGQFVERLLDGHLMNIPDTLSLEDKEISVEIAVVDNELEEQVYHNYGRFIITKIEKEDTTGSYKFESSDYTKKFNEVYTGGVTFPCTALKLLNSACDQVGVGLDVTNNTQAVEYVVPKDGLQAGNYHFVVNETYYNFTLSENLVEGNLLMLKGNKLILRKVTSDYNIIREELVYSTGATGTGTLLSDESYGYYELINDDFVVNDNQFTENNTCRDVVRSVAQLSYTWARINENNKLCLDFVKNDDVDSYDEIDTDKYYEATVTGDKVEPINKVLIGMSQVEGENIVKEQDNDLLGVDTIYGETSQETYTGKNLLNTLNMANQTKNGITCTYDKNAQTITFNGTCTTDNTTFWFSSGNISLDGTYTLSYEVISGTITNTIASTRIQFQRYSDWAGIWLPLTQQNNSTTRNLPNYELTQNNIRFDNGVVVNNYKIRVQLEKNSTKTSWERYVGGIPSPNPDYPQNINTVTGRNTIEIQGKNIYNVDDKYGTWNTDITVDNGWITINSTNSGNSTMYRPFYTYTSTVLKPNKDYWCVLEILGDKSYTGSPSRIEFISNWVDDRCSQFATSFDLNINDSSIVNGAILKQKVTTRNSFENCTTLTKGIASIYANSSFNLTFRMSIVEEEPDINTFVYEPYQSQSYELDLPVENLYNIATNTNGKVIGTDGSEVDSTGYCISDYIAVQPNTTYTISRIYENLPSSEDNMRLGLYTQNKTWIQRVNSSNKPYVYTTPSNCYFIRLSYQYTITNTNVQVELGSKANTYTPYGTTPIELNKIGTYQDYIYKDNDKWYLHKEIGKYVFTGSSNEAWYISGSALKLTNLNTTFNYPISSANYSAITTAGIYCNYGETAIAGSIYDGNKTNNVGLSSSLQSWGGTTDNIYVSKGNLSIADFKTMLASNNLICNYVLATSTNTEITYQLLIDQLNALQNAGLFEGTNYITIDTLNEKPSLDITVTDLEQDSTSYSGKSFEITGHDYDKGGSIYIYDNPLTYTESLRRIAINGAENLFGLTYTPVEVQSIGHPWLTGKEFMKITNLENQELYFYPFDRKISYSGILTTDLSAQAKNEVAQKYENRNNVIDKINHTEISVNKANGTITELNKKVDGNKEEFTQWESTEYNSLKSTVGEINRDLNVGDDSIHSRLSSVEQTTETITSMFQITGGINLIRNSAFLLPDDLWTFTDNGTNPYHTPLGASYNSTLSGQTVSVAEIKARNMKIKSKSENITNLKIDAEGKTKYTFNFYHQQDNNMTTTIKMYSTENNSSKAFNDIVITGQQEFKNYEVSFTPTAYTNYTIEIIVTSTSSVGYAYIYDMMLNAGDKQAWQPASDEIYSTTLQMSRLGLKVYSVGDGTITLLGSDGMSTWETSDGVTLGRLVSMRTEAGDRVKTVTTEALHLTKDIRQENANRWVETIVTISGTPYKVEYIESGGQ